MEARQPRPPRSHLAATAEILGPGDTLLTAQTLNLSVAGCYLETPDPFPVRSQLRLKLLFNESSIVVFGEVVRSETAAGMAVRFAPLPPGPLSILKGWFFAVDRPDF
jgi:hypothetical protein